jgi:hypothetical protein
VKNYTASDLENFHHLVRHAGAVHNVGNKPDGGQNKTRQNRVHALSNDLQMMYLIFSLCYNACTKINVINKFKKLDMAQALFFKYSRSNVYAKMK